MDLVYANRERQDIGVLRSPELDLAFGSEENDFECKIPLSDACCDSGYLIYAEGTEYGGIVDNITVDTASDSVTYSGRTWHGVLGSKCVLPLQEDDVAPSGVTLETYGGNNLFKATERSYYDKLAGIDVFSYDKETYTYTISGSPTGAGNLAITNSTYPTVLTLKEGQTYTLCLRYVSGSITFKGTSGSMAALSFFSKDESKFKRYIFPASYSSGDVAVTFNASDFVEGTNEFKVMLQVWNIGAVFDNFKFHIQIVEGSYAVGSLPPYEPYSATVYNRYLAISGDANRCISYLIDRVGLSELFCAPEADAGVNVSKYQFERYTDAYSGLHNMLASCGMRLNTVHTDGTVMLSAVPAIDYSKEKEFESQLIPFVSKAYKNKVNHLICLGSGELENRLVVHLYADADGNISEMQTFFGVDEYAAVYDYPSAGSAEGEDVTEEDRRNELIASGKERFKELRKADTIDIDFDIADDAYYIGDIVGTLDSKTGISVTAEVKKKIVTLKNNHVNISYIVG